MGEVDYTADPGFNKPGQPTTLYRYWDKDGALLYVGISWAALGRLNNHRSDKGWWFEIASIKLEHFPNRLQALHAEREAIRAERPRHNFTYNEAVRRAPADPFDGVEPWARAYQMDYRVDLLYRTCQLLGASLNDERCVNHLWYGGDMPLRSLVHKLVGYGAVDPPEPWFTTTEAYDAVTSIVDQLLPECDHSGLCSDFEGPNDTVRSAASNLDGGRYLIALIDAEPVVTNSFERDVDDRIEGLTTLDEFLDGPG